MELSTKKILKQAALWIPTGILLALYFFSEQIFNSFSYFQTASPLLSFFVNFCGTFLIIIVAFAALLFIFVRSMAAGSNRHKEFEGKAQELGWKYRGKTELEFLKEAAERLRLGEYLSYHPLRGKTHNLITGKVHNVDGAIKYGELSETDKEYHAEKTRSFEALIFDQIIWHDVSEHGFKVESFFKGSKRNTKSKNQTMFLLKIPDLWLPAFCVEPEGFWNKLHDKLDRFDIDFPDFPVFSHKYQLYGELLDADQKDIFNQNVLQFYERQKPNFITIGHEDRLLIYEPEVLVATEDFHKKIVLLIKLTICFTKSNNSVEKDST